MGSRFFSLAVKVLAETSEVTLLIFLMMIAVDVIHVWTHGQLALIFRGGRRWRQYVFASLIGAAPGCMGGYTNVSLYMHGVISFGALTGSMIAATGDEAFVMLAYFPKAAVLIFGALTVLGMGVGWITDAVIKKWSIPTALDCQLQRVHQTEGNILHYLQDHVWTHIIKKHLLKVFLWTLGAIFLVEVGLKFGNLEMLSSQYPIVTLFAAALLGLIPQSGPHLIFVSMYAKGLVPLSVLVTSAIVQDGHGMLPLLSYSVRDSVMLKSINLGFGLIIGLGLFWAGR